MPDEAPAVETPAAEPAAPAPNETFIDKMERHGGFSEDTESAAPAEPETEPTPAAAAKPKPDVQVNPDHDALKQLCDRLGFEFDGTKVTVGERAELRKERRELRDEITRKEKELREKLDQDRGTHQKDVEKAQGILKAYNDGDYEALAKALGAGTWDDLQKDVIAKIADPHYKRLRELESKVAEKEAGEAAQRAESEKARVAQEQAQLHNNNVAHLQTVMKDSKDPILEAFHDEPLVLQSIYQVQLANWDGKTTVSPAQALKMVVPGGNRAIEAHLKELQARLNKAYPPGGTTETKSTKKPAPKTAPTPRAEPSPPGKYESESERRADWSRRLAEAQEEDRRAEARARMNGRGA